MHPTDRKITYYVAIIMVITIVVTLLCTIRNVSYLIAIIPISAYAFIRKHLNYLQKFILLALYMDIALAVLLILDVVVNKDSNESTGFPLKDFIIGLLFFTPLIISWFKFAYKALLEILQKASEEKKHLSLIKKHPDLFCNKHVTRTNLHKTYGFKSVCCRIDEQCLSQNQIKEAVDLIGCIGIYTFGKPHHHNYYVNLWDHQNQEIRNGDYDIIEIHKNNEIEDYNSIILKVVNFFHNKINRHKPINKVTVRIIGNIELSESTKRLMEKRFLKVEYAPYR